MGCGPLYYYDKTYDYVIENQLTTQVVKIIPTSATGIWITSAESFVVNPENKIIVGSKIINDEDKEAIDIYNQNDIVLPFELFVDDIKIEKDFTRRVSWTFSKSSKNSGKYTLVINENSINNEKNSEL
jgi:hypothetical protein